MVSLPAKQQRVDRLRERFDAIEAFRLGAGRQPVEITVGTRDVTIGARCNPNYDLPLFRSHSPCPANRMRLPSGSRTMKVCAPHSSLRKGWTNSTPVA